MNSRWLIAALVTGLLFGCSQERGVAPDGQHELPGQETVEATPEETKEVVQPTPGSLSGAAVARWIPARWPKIEQGMSGALQAVPVALHEPSTRLETRWLHVKKQGDLHRQAESLEKQRMARRATKDLVDLRAYEGAGLPPFSWRDRTRGRSYVTPTMAAVLIRAYATFRTLYPDRRLSLGDLAQPGGGTLYHGTLVRELEGAEAIDVLNRAHLVDGDLVAMGTRPAKEFPREVHRFTGPDEDVWVEETLLAQHSSSPLRLRVATRRYTKSATPELDHVKEMHREANALMRRGTLLSTTTLPSWSVSGVHKRVRQHWVSPGTRGQLVVYSTRKQRRRLRLNDVMEIRFSRFSARKPQSYQAERRWVPTRVKEGKRTRIESWSRYTAVYEAGHITHLAGRDADISFATHGNLSHFAVNIPNIDAVATLHWFEALSAAARATGTEVEKILVDQSVIRHLRSNLPEPALRTTLFKQVIKRAPGHNAHHHLRLTAPTKVSEANGRRLLSALKGVDPASLVLDVDYSVPAPAMETAARKPEVAADSSPTPSK
jgi:murein endopeptidase